MREKRTDAKRRKGGEKKGEESKGEKFLCVPHESGVLRVFNLEMDRPRIRFYEAS